MRRSLQLHLQGPSFTFQTTALKKSKEIGKKMEKKKKSLPKSTPVDISFCWIRMFAHVPNVANDHFSAREVGFVGISSELR